MWGRMCVYGGRRGAEIMEKQGGGWQKGTLHPIKDFPGDHGQTKRLLKALSSRSFSCWHPRRTADADWLGWRRQKKGSTHRQDIHSGSQQSKQSRKRAEEVYLCHTHLKRDACRCPSMYKRSVSQRAPGYNCNHKCLCPVAEVMWFQLTFAVACNLIGECLQYKSLCFIWLIHSLQEIEGEHSMRSRPWHSKQ